MKNDWKKEYWEGYGNNLKVTDGDDIFAFISSLLADFAKEMIGEDRKKIDSYKELCKKWKEVFFDYKYVRGYRNRQELIKISKKYGIS